MSDHELTSQLAERVLGWKAMRTRFVRPNNTWTPRWKFAPLEKGSHAMYLLEHSGAESYTISKHHGRYTTHVTLRGKVGAAEGELRSRTIAIAVALAAGLNPEAV